MTIPKKPFTNYTLDEDKTDNRDRFTLSLNKEEREQLEEDKKLLYQVKDSTAYKQLAEIGSKAIHEPKIMEYIGIIKGNQRRNKRLGIVDFD